MGAAGREVELNLRLLIVALGLPEDWALVIHRLGDLRLEEVSNVPTQWWESVCLLAAHVLNVLACTAALCKTISIGGGCVQLRRSDFRIGFPSTI